MNYFQNKSGWLLAGALLLASGVARAEDKGEPAAPVGEQLVTVGLTFSPAPTEEEIRLARAFLEPLVPMGKTEAKENAELAAALQAWRAAGPLADPAAVSDFVKKHPKSAWNASLELNLGKMRFEQGYLSEALVRWEDAWNRARKETDPARVAVANAAIAQLMLLEARLGRMEELKEHLQEIEGRNFTGAAEQQLTAAKEGLNRMEIGPGESFKCGPYAVDMLASLGKGVQMRTEVIKAAKSTTQGTNLAQVKAWSDQVGLKYQMAKRSPGAPVLVPAIMHWKVGHFAAITEAHEGRYHTTDPTFGTAGKFWLKPEVLDAESDGYFLVPAGPLPAGWVAVNEAEGKTVWGKGAGQYRNGDAKFTLTPQEVCLTCPPAGPMAVPSVYTMQATLSIRDTPLWYTPAYGPAMRFGATYNDGETNQPVTTYFFTNLTANWIFNWSSYLTVDASRNVTVRVRGGGSEVYDYGLPDNTGNAYSPNVFSQAILVLTAAGTYERRLPDGSVEVFSQPDGSGRGLFLTAVKDPQGNAATIAYNANNRISTITDAAGKVTNFTYVSATVGTVGYYLISTITDPYGHTTSFTYDATLTQLLSITDMIGITSQFTYDSAGSFITTLTTPYGRTLFYKYTRPEENAVGLKFTMPDGSTMVTENWLGADGETKSTYFWDRNAMALYPNDADNKDHTHCVTTYWILNLETAELQPIVAHVKEPLEETVYYEYANQQNGNPIYLGSSNQPTSISRTVNSGTQVYRYEYNARGHVTKSVDPVGRTFSYSYAANNIDLLEVRQTRNGANDLLGKLIYNNTQHLPNVMIDGSGQKTQFGYNGVGQLTSIVNALSNTTTLVYTASTGQLSEIDASSDPAAANAKTTFTYDNSATPGVTTAGLPKTIAIATSATTTYTTTYAYDAASRPTTVTYPDGTYAQAVYTYLDMTMMRDRNGHWSQQSFSSLRQKATETDALGRTTKYSWCTCGGLATLTDAAGNVTAWGHDLEGRVTSKTYADGSQDTFVYDDEISWVVSATDARNWTKNYTYNLDNTLAGVSYSGTGNTTPSVSFTYDPNYMRVLTGSNSWGIVGNTYNAYITDPFGTPTTGAGMVATATNSVIPNSAVSYGYDALGRTTSQSINGASNTMSWVYDAISRVTSVSNALGNFTNTYLNSSYGLSQLTSVAYPNGQTAAMAWYSGSNSATMRLQQIKNTDVTSGTLSQFDYGYDGVGNITSWTQAQSGTATVNANSYDFADQLRGVAGTISGTVSKQYYYNYDLAANRISEQVYTGTTTATVMKSTYNNVNELLTIEPGGATRFTGTTSVAGTVTVGGTAAFMNWSKQFTANPVLNAGTNSITIVAKDGGTTTGTNTYTLVIPTAASGTMTYDAVGNLISDGTNTYQWDGEDRLVGITYSGSGNATQFTYDPLGRRVKIVETGTVSSTKQFVFCGLARCEERDGAGAVTKQYFDGGMRASGTSYYYNLDHLGSVREMVSGSNTIRAQYAYDPYGRVTKLQGAQDPDFQYAGYYVHARSGLNLTMYRAYNPNLGRWISRDPIEDRGGINLYGYVSNNPINARDPLGLAQWIEGPSGSEPTGHQSFNIGDPNGSYTSFSFGVDGTVSWNGGIQLNGDVYEDTETGGPIEKFKLTTPEEDDAMLKRMRGLEGNSQDGYGGETCRSWSQRQFDFGPGTPATPPPRIPTPRDWWRGLTGLTSGPTSTTTSSTSPSTSK